MSWSMLTKRAAMQMRSLQPAFVQTFPKIIRPPKSDRLLVPHLTQQRLRLLGDFGDEKLLNRHARLLPHHGSAAKDAFWPAPARRARMHGRRTRERPPGANSIFARMFPPGQRRAGFHRRALFSPNQRLVKAGLFSAFRMAQSTICCAVSLQSLGPALPTAFTSTR